MRAQQLAEHQEARVGISDGTRDLLQEVTRTEIN
jgi:hypothetical protein